MGSALARRFRPHLGRLMHPAVYTAKTPAYVIDEARLRHNLEILHEVAQESGAKILLAQKAFSAYACYPLIGRYLSGTTASGLYEARLGHEEMGGETHVFSAAYLEHEFDEIIHLCDHIVFNSLHEWEKYKTKALASQKSFGLRVNPEHSTQDHGLYDPCAPGSRLGITRAQFGNTLPAGIEGLHFHTLCEQNSDALIETVQAFEDKFSAFLPQLQWVNFGGGHHITRPDYDRAALIDCVQGFAKRHDVQVYLEPGEAVALNAGYLVSRILDIVENEMQLCIMDASAACHMPDVLEMPYTPPLYQAAKPGEKAHHYRLGGPTCLSGDIIGDYSFDTPLHRGDTLVFEDMAIYSMVKNNTFNGMALPSIYLLRANGQLELIKSFGYEDFKQRL